MLIRQASPSDTPQVAAILTLAAENLARRGEALWDLAHVSERAIEPHVLAGMYYLLEDDEGPVGVFRFQLEDSAFWPEIAPGTSAFVHKVAVHPRAQGREIAQRLLAHALELAREQGVQYLRLDCRHGRPKLSEVYVRFGFRLHSVKQLGPNLYERYELAT
jgi:GNAT superfamily N-acetyltransferase